MIQYKQQNELYQDYKQRLFNHKEQYGLTWKDIADLLNDQNVQYKSADGYRKQYSKWLHQKIEQNENPDTFQQINTETQQEKENSTRTQQQQYFIDKYKLSQLVTQNNAYVRRIAREQTIKEIAHDYATQMANKPLPFIGQIFVDNSLPNDDIACGVLQLSDWHYGIECNNHWNIYNTEIAKKRINILLFFFY